MNKIISDRRELMRKFGRSCRGHAKLRIEVSLLSEIQWSRERESARTVLQLLVCWAHVTSLCFMVRLARATYISWFASGVYSLKFFPRAQPVPLILSPAERSQTSSIMRL